jgi:hypothetical protein
MSNHPDHLAHIVALLERTPGTLDELLRGLPSEWIDRNEGGDTWSPREVVAHLAHAERTEWVNHILEHGESRPFPPFNREGGRAAMQGKSMAELLVEFAAVRAESLEKLRALTLSDDDLQRRSRHEILGTVTLEELLTTWAAHDISHLHQITRCMAHNIREGVGPFHRFLGVMKCSARSEQNPAHTQR